MDLSVVIVSFNAPEFLRLTLKSVFAALSNIQGEVIVVDNSLNNSCVDLVRKEFADCLLIDNKDNPGFSVANNQGIKKAQGDYILILNPDTIIAEDTFEKMLSFMRKKENMGGLGIRMLDGSGGFLPESKRGIPSPWASFSKMSGLSMLFPTSSLFAEYQKGYLSELENHSVEILAGAYMCFPKSVLNQIGGFDEDFFMYGEDIDLSYRSILAGYKNYFFSDSAIIHFKGESTVKDKVYVKRFYKAMIQFAEKHFGGAYGFVLKAFIYFGVFVVRSASVFRHILPVSNKKQTKKREDLYFLSHDNFDESILGKLTSRFSIHQVHQISTQHCGTILFKVGSTSFKQMVEIMDTYKDHFSYRFFDEEHKLIIGSDSKFKNGSVIAL